MARSRSARTGIDLGTAAVKLVRGEGARSITRLTHAGIESWSPASAGDEVARAADALGRLLKRLGCSGHALGRIAVAAADDDVAMREVVVPAMTEEDLRASLPYEARRHLYFDGMKSPIFDAQVLGLASPSEGETGPSMRALVVAAPGKNREFALSVLAKVNLEPEVVDLEPFACLNAAARLAFDHGANSGPVALLDLGRLRTRMAITHREGGLLTRCVGPGVPPEGEDDAQAAYVATVAANVRETMLFYRGRYRREVARVGLAGGGALRSGLAAEMQAGVGAEMPVLDPLRHPSAAELRADDLAGRGPQLVTAYGLCRWWDESDV